MYGFPFYKLKYWIQFDFVSVIMTSICLPELLDQNCLHASIIPYLRDIFQKNNVPEIIWNLVTIAKSRWTRILLKTCAIFCKISILPVIHYRQMCECGAQVEVLAVLVNNGDIFIKHVKISGYDTLNDILCGWSTYCFGC